MSEEVYNLEPLSHMTMILVSAARLMRLERIAAEHADSVPASADALDDICILLDAPDWEYPGQVVRDVAKAIGMSVEEMAKKLEENRTPPAAAGEAERGAP